MKVLYIFASKQTGKFSLWSWIQIEVVFISNSICTSVEHSVKIKFYEYNLWHWFRGWYRWLVWLTHPPTTTKTVQKMMGVFDLDGVKWLHSVKVTNSIWRGFCDWFKYDWMVPLFATWVKNVSKLKLYPTVRVKQENWTITFLLFNITHLTSQTDSTICNHKL